MRWQPARHAICHTKYRTPADVVQILAIGIDFIYSEKLKTHPGSCSLWCLVLALVITKVGCLDVLATPPPKKCNFTDPCEGYLRNAWNLLPGLRCLHMDLCCLCLSVSIEKKPRRPSSWPISSIADSSLKTPIWHRTWNGAKCHNDFHAL